MEIQNKKYGLNAARLWFCKNIQAQWFRSAASREDSPNQYCMRHAYHFLHMHGHVHVFYFILFYIDFSLCHRHLQFDIFRVHLSAAAVCSRSCIVFPSSAFHFFLFKLTSDFLINVYKCRNEWIRLLRTFRLCQSRCSIAWNKTCFA